MVPGIPVAQQQRARADSVASLLAEYGNIVGEREPIELIHPGNRQIAALGHKDKAIPPVSPGSADHALASARTTMGRASKLRLVISSTSRTPPWPSVTPAQTRLPLTSSQSLYGMPMVLRWRAKRRPCASQRENQPPSSLIPRIWPSLAATSVLARPSSMSRERSCSVSPSKTSRRVRSCPESSGSHTHRASPVANTPPAVEPSSVIVA